MARRESFRSALLLIDVVNHFDFPDSDRILDEAMKVGKNIAACKRRAVQAGIPVIYVNDHFGDWRSERSALIAKCVAPDAKGSSFVRMVEPTEEDYFVLKPMHSGFYQTPLETLLRELDVNTLILAGLTSDNCVMCTAHDANMRDYGLIVPSDCSSAKNTEEHRAAIKHLAQTLGAKTGKLASLRFPRRK